MTICNHQSGVSMVVGIRNMAQNPMNMHPNENAIHVVNAIFLIIVSLLSGGVDEIFDRYGGIF